MENNPFEKLYKDIGYREFIRQLIKFEIAYVEDDEVEKILEEFIGNDYYSSIFQIQEIIDGVVEESRIKEEFCSCGNTLDEYNICRECI